MKNIKKPLISGRKFDDICYNGSKDIQNCLSSTLKEPLGDKKNLIYMEINKPLPEWFSKI